MGQQIEMVPGGYKVVEVHKYLSAGDLIPFGQQTPIKGITRRSACKETSLESITNEYANQMQAPFYEFGKNKTRVQLYVENTAIK